MTEPFDTTTAPVVDQPLALTEAFDIAGPLPMAGRTTLLEASAGTGKTWTIAALVTRYVAEGTARLEELLVVTFTRAASQELRDRVRRQLLEAAVLLAPDTTATPANALEEWLLDCPADEREQRRRRLQTSLADFDAATIATIHQFCQMVLRSLGVAGDSDTDATLVEDLDDLTVEVVADLYLARWVHDPAPPWKHSDALALARRVVSDPHARVEPESAPAEAPDSPQAMRVRFAQDVLAEIERRKRRMGVLSYDDLLHQLASALAEPDSAASKRMRARWKVALIDEFQDTDPVQWDVFHRAFEGAATLVLIGDPKQAVYAFRGGDISTYLSAAATATERRTLGTNFRTDAALLDSVHAVLGGAALGDERIVVHPVDAHHRGTRLGNVDEAVDPEPAFQMRVVRRAEIGRGPRDKVPVAPWRDHVARDLAADVKRLLTSGTTFDGAPLRPGQVAVLASRRHDLERARQALAEVGVPAVVAGGGSVFSSPAARQWIVLLEALEQPHRTTRVRAAALTDFIGHSASELDADEAVDSSGTLTDALADKLRGWAAVFAARGVAAVLECAVLDGLTARCLGVTGGQRTLTDIRHIGETLHRTAVSEQWGLAGLLGWLREQAEDESGDSITERTRRLDSDAEAVQLVTIHGSKGLEYPVVYLPSLWDRWVGDPDVPLYHDDEGRRCRDVSGRGGSFAEATARHHREEAGESLRLLYVALTRAQSRVVAWYAPSGSTTTSAPLHRMLFGRRPGQTAVPDQAPVPDDDKLVQVIQAWRSQGGAAPAAAVVGSPDTTPLPVETPALSSRSFDRTVDTDWRRTSYTALSRPLHDELPHGGDRAADRVPDDVRAGSEPEDDLLLLEGPDVEEAEGSTDSTAWGHLAAELAGVPSPMATLPMGATFGSLVHAVLEHTDPEPPGSTPESLRQRIAEQIADQQEFWSVDLDADVLADALVQVHDSPLGPLAGEATLRQIALADRLAELDFEVPLAGGDDRGHAARPVPLGALAPLLRAHLPEGDPVRQFADSLDALPALAQQSLHGYLTGSIDVVLRVPVDGATRYLTVDYKTNWLGGTDTPLTAHDYRPEALDEAMGHSDYPLQALLYTVVLHRFLRWRLADYDPEAHLGGVLYLYLRGMCGPDTPRVDGQPCGVFSWRPPTALVLALSDLLDGEQTTAHETTRDRTRA